MIEKLKTLKEKPELAIFDELITLNKKLNSIKDTIKNINIKEVKTYEQELEVLSNSLLSLEEVLKGKEMVVNFNLDSLVSSINSVETAIKNIKEVKIPEFPKSIGLDELQINELLFAIQSIPEFPIEDLSKMIKSLETKIGEIKLEIPEQEQLDYEFLDNKFRSLEKAVKGISITVAGGGGGIGEIANANLEAIKNNTGALVGYVDFGGIGEDTNYYYFGEYIPETEKWRIQRLAKVGYAITWASGESDLQTAWDDRATHTYNINL
jgi:hypothetical protein